MDGVAVEHAACSMPHATGVKGAFLSPPAWAAVDEALAGDETQKALVREFAGPL